MSTIQGVKLSSGDEALVSLCIACVNQIDVDGKDISSESALQKALEYLERNCEVYLVRSVPATFVALRGPFSS